MDATAEIGICQQNNVPLKKSCMRPKILFWLFLSAGILLSCSKNGDTLPSDESSKIPDFKLVGEDAANIYQYNYIATLQDGEIINLTQENNIGLQYLTLRQVDDLLTFYNFSGGSFSAIQRNAVTGANGNYDNFYTVSDERSILWGTNSDRKLFLGYFSPIGSNNFGVRSFDLATDEESDINIEFKVNNVFQPIYSEGKLILTYRDQQNSYKVAIMDATSNSLLRTLDFGGANPSTFIDSNGDMAIILGKENNNHDYIVYDLETLNIVEERVFDLDRFFATGPLQAYFENEKLYYLSSFIQPSPVVAGPAVYDFISGENTVVDMIGIVQDLEQELQANITLSAFAYEKNGNVFIMGYGKQEGAILEGGVLLISSEGKLIDHIVLPFAPTYIVQ